MSNPVWEPPEHAPELEHALSSGLWTLQNRMAETDFSSKPRFSRSQLVALQRLRRLPIVIKPADKNLGLVVLDRDKYIAEGDRQLSYRNVYSPVSSVPWTAMYASLKQLQARFRHLLFAESLEIHFAG